jgi:hypothetical protein
MFKKVILKSILISVVLLLVIVSPVLAITNPDTISFGTSSTPSCKVFYNVFETDDWYIIAEGNVYYAVEPTDYSASSAYVLELLDSTGTTVLLATPLQEYGDRPIGMYVSATQVATLGLTVGSLYQLRISGNPLIFPSMVGNSVTVVLSPTDYIDQELGADGGVPTENAMRNFCIGVAENIQKNDAPPAGYEYIIAVGQYRYLTANGSAVFTMGLPSIIDACPILFQSSISQMQDDEPTSTNGTYASMISASEQWGETTANGLRMLGIWVGLSESVAGMVVLSILSLLLAFYVYKRTNNGVITLLVIVFCPFVGAFLGLMNLALAFIIAMVIVILFGFYFFGKGGTL